MKAAITQAERLRIAEWMTDARQLLAGVEDLERHIATTLGFKPDDDRDTITDAVTLPLTVDQLLRQLSIEVSDEAM